MDFDEYQNAKWKRIKLLNGKLKKEIEKDIKKG